MDRSRKFIVYASILFLSHFIIIIFLLFKIENCDIIISPKHQPSRVCVYRICGRRVSFAMTDGERSIYLCFFLFLFLNGDKVELERNELKKRDEGIEWNFFFEAFALFAFRFIWLYDAGWPAGSIGYHYSNILSFAWFSVQN